MVYKILETTFELNDLSEYEIKSILVDKTKHEFHELFFCRQDTTFYVDNLNLLYVYIIKFLCDNEIKFDFAYKNGKCSNVKTCINDCKILFINFKAKFGVDFSSNYEDNKKLIDYALEHHRTKLSLGADAYSEFLHTIFKRKEEENANYNLIREDFPIFKYDDMLLEAKKNVYGFQHAQAGRYKNIYDYDISGSYPASALNDTPTGPPHYYDKLEDAPKSYFKIIKFTYFDCKLKANGIDFVKVQSMGSLTLTERLFELFKECYSAKIIIKKIEAFKTRKSMFKQFIEQTVIAGKTMQKDKILAQYNKAVGNAIIGYLGRNETTLQNTAKITQNGLEIDKVEKEIDPIYLPAYLAILDASKAKFLKAIKPYWKNILYANTDGFLCTKEIELAFLNFRNTNKLLGNFRLCHKYNDIYVECINGYAGITEDGEIVNTISGMSFERILTPDDYQSKTFVYYVNEPTPSGTIRRSEIYVNN